MMMTKLFCLLLLSGCLAAPSSGGGHDLDPVIDFRKDESDRTLTVVGANSGLHWSDFTVYSCKIPDLYAPILRGDALTDCYGQARVDDKNGHAIYVTVFPPPSG
jgi:hypothetical protein